MRELYSFPFPFCVFFFSCFIFLGCVQEELPVTEIGAAAEEKTKAAADGGTVSRRRFFIFFLTFTRRCVVRVEQNSIWYEQIEKTHCTSRVKHTVRRSGAVLKEGNHHNSPFS